VWRLATALAACAVTDDTILPGENRAAVSLLHEWERRFSVWQFGGMPQADAASLQCEMIDHFCNVS
jgi:hypothetical protein